MNFSKPAIDGKLLESVVGGLGWYISFAVHAFVAGLAEALCGLMVIAGLLTSNEYLIIGSDILYGDEVAA